MSFFTIAAIKHANARRGHFFFQPATLRFFRSRIGQTVYGGRFFVTSEQFNCRSPRLYTIREAREDGSVETVGEFQAFRSGRAAVARIREMLRQDSQP